MHLLLTKVLVVVLLLMLLLMLLMQLMQLILALLSDPLRLLYPLCHLGLRPKLLLLMECPALLFPECEQL